MMYFHFFKFIFSALLLSNFAYASSEMLINSTGKDLVEAQVRATRQAVMQMTGPESNLLKNVLEPEIVPYAQQFISSYRVLEAGKGGLTSIQATVDADLLKSLVALNPKSLGIDEKSAKILLVTHVPKLASGKEDLAYSKPFEHIVQERFQRRHFQIIKPTGALADQILLGEEALSPEFLQPLGRKLGAALVIGVSASLGQVENENNHNTEERIFLEGILVDCKKNTVLSRHKNSTLSPAGRRELVSSIIDKAVNDRGDELVQELLVHGGESYLRAVPIAGGLLVRVIDAESFMLLNQFRVALEGQKDVRSVLETSIRRGAYDFRVETSLSPSQMAQRLKVLSGDNFTVQLDTSSLGKDYDLALRLVKKEEVAAPAATSQK